MVTKLTEFEETKPAIQRMNTFEDSLSGTKNKAFGKYYDWLSGQVNENNLQQPRVVVAIPSVGLASAMNQLLKKGRCSVNLLTD